MIRKSIRLSACALTLGLACALPAAAQSSGGGADAPRSTQSERGDKDWGWLGLLGLAGLFGLKRRDSERSDTRTPGRTAM